MIARGNHSVLFLTGVFSAALLSTASGFARAETFSRSAVFRSSVTVSSNTVLSGTTFYHGGSAVLGGSGSLIRIPGKLRIGSPSASTATLHSSGTIRTDNVFNSKGTADGTTYTHYCVVTSLGGAWSDEFKTFTAISMTREKIGIKGGIIVSSGTDAVNCPDISY